MLAGMATTIRTRSRRNTQGSPYIYLRLEMAEYMLIEEAAAIAGFRWPGTYVREIVLQDAKVRRARAAARK